MSHTKRRCFIDLGMVQSEAVDGVINTAIRRLMDSDANVPCQPMRTGNSDVSGESQATGMTLQWCEIPFCGVTAMCTAMRC